MLKSTVNRLLGRTPPPEADAKSTRKQGRAEGAQVKNARLGMGHNLGGPGSVSSVTILGLPD